MDRAHPVIQATKSRPAVPLDLVPGEAVTPAGVGGWQMGDGPDARLELRLPEGQRWPRGWILLTMQLEGAITQLRPRLLVERQIGEAPTVHDLPLTLKGNIAELIRLGPGVRRVWLCPLGGPGRFQVKAPAMSRPRYFERFYIMARRIEAVRRAHSPRVIRRVGLGHSRFFSPMSKQFVVAGLLRDQAGVLPYEHFLDHFADLSARDRRQIHTACRRLKRRPSFFIRIEGPAEGEAARLTARSIDRQCYPAAGILAAGASLPAADAEADDWVITVQAGEILADHALFWFAAALQGAPDAAAVYADHDHLDAEGRQQAPHFKPDWSPELLRAIDYIGYAAALRRGIDQQAAGADNQHDRLLRATETLVPAQIIHIPAVLFHYAVGMASAAGRPARETAPVIAHLQRLGLAAEVLRGRQGTLRIQYALPAELPLVSIIVPTRDALEHLRKCIDSVLALTTYRPIELIIVDNQSERPETRAYLARVGREPGVRVLPYDRPFNFSAINNAAAQAARGTFICMLNNDTEVISADWLQTMLGHLMQPDVGAVGAKLLYSDGTVQHAGDAVGPGGLADHMHSRIGRDEPGYMGRALVAQEVSAVTAACLLTRRDLFLDLGGFDAENLPVAFNDVDFCLRVRERGLRVIWTPHAELYHHESVSRGRDKSAERKAQALAEIAYMRMRWAHCLEHDPYYNPNLNYGRPDFSLSRAPRVCLPWEKNA